MIQYLQLLRRERCSGSSASLTISSLYIWYWMTMMLMLVVFAWAISHSKIGDMMWHGLFLDMYLPWRSTYAHIACSWCAFFVLSTLIPIRQIVTNSIILRNGIILFHRREKAGPDWNQRWRWIHFCIDCCFVRTMHYAPYITHVIPLMAVWRLSILFYV